MRCRSAGTSGFQLSCLPLIRLGADDTAQAIRVDARVGDMWVKKSGVTYGQFKEATVSPIQRACGKLVGDHVEDTFSTLPDLVPCLHAAMLRALHSGDLRFFTGLQMGNLRSPGWEYVRTSARMGRRLLGLREFAAHLANRRRPAGRCASCRSPTRSDACGKGTLSPRRHTMHPHVCTRVDGCLTRVWVEQSPEDHGFDKS